MKIWGVIMPLISALIGSATTLTVALMVQSRQLRQETSQITATTQTEIRYRIAMEDRLELDRIRVELQREISNFKAEASSERQWEIFDKLSKLAEEEARILRQYDPNFESRWIWIARTLMPHEYGPLLRSPILWVSVWVLVFFMWRYITRVYLRHSYEISTGPLY
jgi:hypothetical protein